MESTRAGLRLRFQTMPNAIRNWIEAKTVSVTTGWW